jgi:hypothetical protein
MIGRGVALQSRDAVVAEDETLFPVTPQTVFEYIGSGIFLQIQQVISS